jgi:hypothetical protein
MSEDEGREGWGLRRKREEEMCMKYNIVWNNSRKVRKMGGEWKRKFMLNVSRSVPQSVFNSFFLSLSLSHSFHNPIVFHVDTKRPQSRECKFPPPFRVLSLPLASFSDTKTNFQICPQQKPAHNPLSLSLFFPIHAYNNFWFNFH